jgi:hypothetical protein
MLRGACYAEHMTSGRGRKANKQQQTTYMNHHVQVDGQHWLWLGPVRVWMTTDGVEHVTPTANLPGMRNAYARGIAYRLMNPDTDADMRVRQGCEIDLCVRPDHSVLSRNRAAEVTDELGSLSTSSTGLFGTVEAQPELPAAKKETRAERQGRELVERRLADHGSAYVDPSRHVDDSGPLLDHVMLMTCMNEDCTRYNSRGTATLQAQPCSECGVLRELFPMPTSGS